MTSIQQTRTVAQKMGVKPGLRAYLRDAPATAVTAMGLPDLDVPETLTGELDYLHLFVVTQDRLREQFGELRDRLRPGGMLWVSWPKGGKLGTDLTIKSVIAIGYELNMVREHLPAYRRGLVGTEVHPPQARQDLRQQLRHPPRPADLTAGVLIRGGRVEGRRR
ncbi:hypothetical protein [Kocuria palustris]